MADENEPMRRVAVHVLGERLDDLSVGEFEERIALLRAEIERLETAKRAKQAALEQAGSVFKR